MEEKRENVKYQEVEKQEPSTTVYSDDEEYEAPERKLTSPETDESGYETASPGEDSIEEEIAALKREKISLTIQVGMLLLLSPVYAAEAISKAKKQTVESTSESESTSRSESESESDQDDPKNKYPIINQVFVSTPCQINNLVPEKQNADSEKSIKQKFYSSNSPKRSERTSDFEEEEQITDSCTSDDELSGEEIQYSSPNTKYN